MTVMPLKLPEQLCYKGRPPLCPDCGAPMVLYFNKKYGKPKWSCPKFPACRGGLGALRDGTPRGIAVSSKVRRKRSLVHILLEYKWNKDDSKSVAAGRTWLQQNCYKRHISEMDEKELDYVVRTFLEFFPEYTERFSTECSYVFL